MYFTLTRAWFGFRAGRSLLESLKVASGPERTGSPEGLLARSQVLVVFGLDILN